VRGCERSTLCRASKISCVAFPRLRSLPHSGGVRPRPGRTPHILDSSMLPMSSKHSQPMTTFKRIDTWIWILIEAALIAAYLYPNTMPRLNQDSYQYLSVAENALRGNIAYTSLVHFDAERSFGRMPAPLVTFPAGYGIAIAAVSLLGLSAPVVGFAISVISILLCIPLLMWMSARAELSRMLGNVVVALFVLNANTIIYGSNVMTEALFTILGLAGVALIIQAKRRNASGVGWYWMAAGLSFAAAYYVRYAGMFFVLGLGTLVIYYAVTADRAMLKGYLIAFSVSAVAVLVVIARNIYLVNNWRGGNDKVVSNPFFQTVGKALQGTNMLLLGPGSGAAGGTTGPRLVCVLLFVVGMTLLGVVYTRASGSKRDAATPRIPIAIEVIFLIAAYMACLFYAGLKSVIDYGDPRYFLPIVPMLFLLIGIGVSRWTAVASERSLPMRKVALIGLSASAIIYFGLNLLLFRLPSNSRPSPLEIDISESRIDNAAFRDKVLEIVGENGIIISNNGQNVGHVLDRPMVSLVGPRYSKSEWTEAAVREVAARYKARAIVIYIPVGEQWDDGDYMPSAFVRQLAEGKPPAWMRLSLRSKRLLVYVSPGTNDISWTGR